MKTVIEMARGSHDVDGVMSEDFNRWWNEDLLTEDNPFVDGTPAFWAWEGWCAGVNAEREACARLVDYWEARQGEHADAIRARGQA